MRLEKEIFAVNANSLINYVRVAKAEGFKMSVERNLFLTRFEEHITALQALINANVKWKVTLKCAIKTIMKLEKSGRSFGRLEYSEKIAKWAKTVQRLFGLMDLKEVKLQTMPLLVKEADRLRKELAQDKD